MTLVSHGPIYFISDFNVEMLVRQVANSVLPGTETKSAPFGQVIEALAAGPPGPEWSAVVWSQPASIIAAFNRALIYDAPATDSEIGRAHV